MSNNQGIRHIKKSLQDKGFRLTKERETIIETLRKCKCPLTADNLYLKIVKSTPTVSRATVYRCLKLLVGQDIINQINYGGKIKSRFDTNIKSYRYYAICRNCGKVKDICLKVDDLRQKAQELSEYRILSYNIAFVGICPRCKKVV